MSLSASSLQDSELNRPESAPPLKLCIIGTGKVGRSLANALTRARYEVDLVDKEQSEQLKCVNHADLVLLTVQDRQIAEVCNHIATALSPETVVAHCSGALDSAPLQSAKLAGSHVGSAHPLNTFPNDKAAEQLLSKPNHQTHCFISGDEQASSLLHKIFTSIGFKTSMLNDEAKVAYHAASVFLCNYLTSLAELGLQTAEHAGLDRTEFWEAVQPLIQATLKNISEQGTTAALSGPIARGDLTTVTSHLNTLANAPELLSKAYCVLGEQAAELAANKDQVSTDDIKRIKSIQNILK